MAVDAFDLAERLQTPVFVMTDLDLGMNVWMSDPFPYPERPLDRGKVLSKEDLDRLGGFARYADVDGDGIGWRTLPGTRPPEGGVLHPRHRARRERGLQRGPAHFERNIDRLARKLEARAISRAARRWRDGPGDARVGVIATARRTPPSARRARSSSARPGSRRTACACAPTRSRARCTRSWQRTSASTSSSRTATGSSRRSLKLDLAPELAPRLRPIAHIDGLPLDARAGHRRDPRRGGEADMATHRDPPPARGRTGSASPSSSTAAASPRSAPAAATTRSPSGSSRRCSSMGVPPERVAKFSGIGCSSKSPAYFMNRSHAFNALHGRMPSVATGAALANRDAARARRLRATGTPRRSASASSSTSCAGTSRWSTSSRTTACTGSRRGSSRRPPTSGSKLKTGVVNDLPPIDTLRARDPARRDVRRPLVLRRQAAALRDAQGRDRAPRDRDARRRLAVRHVQRPRGLDEVVRVHEGARRPAARARFVPAFEDITVEYDPGTTHRRDDARWLAPPAAEARGGLRSPRPRARGRRGSWRRTRAATC